MSCRGILLVITCCISSLYGQQPADGPANERAQKTFQEALQLQKKHHVQWALDSFKKADKQDGGHCLACQRNMVAYGIELQDWKTAETASDEMIAEAQGDKALALAHFHFGGVLLAEAIERKKDELFTRAHEEMTKALAAFPNFPGAMFADGQALAYLKQDDAAKARFEQFAKLRPEDDPDRRRALRYIDQPELARARMAPAFAVTTTDGQRLSLDDLKGKVVLLDFWATWCEPCREALPHMRDLAKKFQGQPLLLLSVSLDDDEQKWKDFVAKNEMSWPQYRDGGFTGPIARLFDVKAIPHTFTIDADGILRDEHVGDAAIEGKIKKLITRARDIEVRGKTQ